jgi:hypothetical protein
MRVSSPRIPGRGGETNPGLPFRRFCLFPRRQGENQEEAEHGVASPAALPDAGSTPASTNLR